MIAHCEISSIMLLDLRHINVRDNHNWTFDVKDNEDEDANQLPLKDGANIDMESIWDDLPA